MKSIVILEIEHDQPILGLANRIAGRVWSMQGIKNVEPMKVAPMTHDEMEQAGFSLSEISLGAQEVERG